MKPDDSRLKKKKQVLTRLQRAAQAQGFAGASNALFGGITDRYEDQFEDLQDDLKQADVSLLFRTYISEMFMFSTIAAICGFGMAIIIDLVAPLPTVVKATMFFALPVLLGALTFAGMYIYPSWKASKRRANIDSNLPFALNHMSAVAGSGVPPSAMFGLLVNFEEYGEISTESRKIVTKVHAFGEDITTAIRDVAKDSPSEDLEEIYYGIVSTIETGGSLHDFLNETAERTLFDYRIARQKQIERLTTYASFYTALLVAAPLFLITLLAILEVIGGELMGMPLRSTCGVVGSLMGQCPIGVIDIGAYLLIPIANASFILFLEVTQPEI